MNDAKRAQKPNRSSLTTEHIAYHEAGHFVAAYFGGIHETIDFVTIETDGEAAGNGEESFGENVSGHEFVRFMVRIFAGHAAATRFDPTAERELRLAARDDDADAARLLDLAHVKGKKRAELERRLRRLADSTIEEHWDSICALAKELVRRNTLDSYEAARIVAVAEGKQARRELLEYRRTMKGIDAWRIELARKAPQTHVVRQS